MMTMSEEQAGKYDEETRLCSIERQRRPRSYERLFMLFQVLPNAESPSTATQLYVKGNHSLY